MPGVSQVGRLRNKVTFKTTTLSEDSYGGFTKAYSYWVGTSYSLLRHVWHSTLV